MSFGDENHAAGPGDSNQTVGRANDVAAAAQIQCESAPAMKHDKYLHHNDFSMLATPTKRGGTVPYNAGTRSVPQSPFANKKCTTIGYATPRRVWQNENCALHRSETYLRSGGRQNITSKMK